MYYKKNTILWLANRHIMVEQETTDFVLWMLCIQKRFQGCEDRYVSAEGIKARDIYFQIITTYMIFDTVRINQSS